jgi:hypothetical protein
MVNIPTQREPGSAQIYQAWAEHGLGPDSAVDLGDGTSMTLRELLGESDEQEHDDDR